MSEPHLVVDNQHPHEDVPTTPLERAGTWLLAELQAEGHALAGRGPAEVGQPAVVHLFLLGDGAMQALNRRLFGRDHPTDVIAQPLATPGDPDPVLGEVYVSLDRARQEADARGLPFEEELLRYVFHGLLHLAGFRDDQPEARERMWARQEALVSSWRARNERR